MTTLPLLPTAPAKHIKAASLPGLRPMALHTPNTKAQVTIQPLQNVMMFKIMPTRKHPNTVPLYVPPHLHIT